MRGGRGSERRAFEEENGGKDLKSKSGHVSPVTLVTAAEAVSLAVVLARSIDC